MRILAICPTIYPEKMEKMHASFDITVSKNTQLAIINKKGSITKLINETFERYPDFDFYHITNDDVIYETPLWDLELAKKGKITHGDDGFQGSNLCTFPMIDGNIARALGWLQMPTLNRYCGDVVWKLIGQYLDILEYYPKVLITHKWDGCSEPLVNELDMAAFAEWLPQSHKDIEKIRRIL